MHFYDMVGLNDDHQQKLMKEAEKHRLVKEAQQGHTTYPTYAPLMAKVGEVLSEIGNALQVRYSEPDKTTIEMSHPVAAGKRG